MKPLLDTYVIKWAICKDCGGMVIGQANNTHLVQFEDWDWIWYCANKGCNNHTGTGVFQEDPEWVGSK